MHDSQQDDTGRTLVDDLVEFLDRYYREQLGELAQGYPRDVQALTIDYGDLRTFDTDIADDYLTAPGQMRTYLREAIQHYDLPVDTDLSGVGIHLTNLPDARTYYVGGYRSNTIGELISVRGQVAKQTGVKSRPVVAAFECQRCGTVTEVPQHGGDFQEPHECSGCDRQGPFTLQHEQSEWQDVQLCRLQLPPEQTKGGNSATVDVHLADDLVDSVEPGDRVTVAAEHDIDDESDGVGFDHRLDAEAIQVEESDYQTIDVDEHLERIETLASGAHGDPYDLLIDSIAPEIIGNREEKEALALQLFGGVGVDGETRQRGDIHILLLGDPGTAKSTMLEAIESKAPTSTLASGKGASEAGMTAAAVKDDFGGGSQWSLEAGAMVLADGGVACIDELDKVDETVVQSLHQAMSRQVVPIDKADINCQLPSRTATLAAGNPKHGRFSTYEPIADQIDLGPTLLSRFDLLFMLQDQPDRDSDSEVTRKKVENRDQAIAHKRGELDTEHSDITPAVPDEILRAWVAHARQSIYPRWESDEARKRIEQSFIELRLANGADPDQPVPVTYRALDAKQRLAEASARVRLSDTVEVEDAERANRLFQRSMRDVGIDPEAEQLDADVIETGTSKTQRDRVHSLLEIVGDIAAEYDEGAPKNVVIERAEEQGIGTESAEYELEKLKQKGEIYESQPGHFRAT